MRGLCHELTSRPLFFCGGLASLALLSRRQLQRANMMNFACGLPRRPSVAAALAAIFVNLSDHSAWSQTLRTIKVVVPFAAGGVGDTLARLMAEQIGRAH